jgi:hypothetical protein
MDTTRSNGSPSNLGALEMLEWLVILGWPPCNGICVEFLHHEFPE